LGKKKNLHSTKVRKKERGRRKQAEGSTRIRADKKGAVIVIELASLIDYFSSDGLST